MKLFAIYLITDGEFQEVWQAELPLNKPKDLVTVLDCLKEGKLIVGQSKLQTGKAYPKALVDLIAIDDSKIGRAEAMARLEEEINRHKTIWEGERLTPEEVKRKEATPEVEVGEIVVEPLGS